MSGGALWMLVEFGQRSALSINPLLVAIANEFTIVVNCEWTLSLCALQIIEIKTKTLLFHKSNMDDSNNGFCFRDAFSLGIHIFVTSQGILNSHSCTHLQKKLRFLRKCLQRQMACCFQQMHDDFASSWFFCNLIFHFCNSLFRFCNLIFHCSGHRKNRTALK